MLLPLSPCPCMSQYQPPRGWEETWQFGCTSCPINTGHRILATGDLLKSHLCLVQSNQTDLEHGHIIAHIPISAPPATLFCMSCTSQPMSENEESGVHHPC